MYPVWINMIFFQVFSFSDSHTDFLHSDIVFFNSVVQFLSAGRDMERREGPPSSLLVA